VDNKWTGGRGGVKNARILWTSFMDGPLLVSGSRGVLLMLSLAIARTAEVDTVETFAISKTDKVAKAENVCGD